MASYYAKGLQAVRKVAFYFFTVLILGNGVISNFLLKGYWGRPRPAQVDAFGGTQAFEPSLWIDLSSFGKSFPCGHATMGFYFFALALLLRGTAQKVVFIFALLFGALIGLSRMSYGGHFLTDVAWAGIIMWLVAFGLHRALGLNHQWRYVQNPPRNQAQAKRRQFIRFILIPFTLAVLLWIGTRSPRDKSDSLTLEPTNQSLQLQLDLRGELKFEKVEAGASIQFITRAQGFGFPKTKLLLKSELGDNPASTRVFHQVRGFFSDLRASTRILLPAGHKYNIQLDPARINGLSLEGQPLEAKPILKLDWSGQP
jgi:hypothetical protein